MNLIYSFISSISSFIQSINDVPFHACDGYLAFPMSLGIFDPSHESPLASKDILLQEDKIIDTFLNVTLPSLHANALSSRDDTFVNNEPSIHSNALSFGDDAFVNDESLIPSNALSSRDVAFLNDEFLIYSNSLSSRDDALTNDESPSTFDPIWINVEKMSSNNYYTSFDDFVNVIYVSPSPRRPKRPVIYVTPNSPSSKRVCSINGVPFNSDSPYFSKAPS